MSGRALVVAAVLLLGLTLPGVAAAQEPPGARAGLAPRRPRRRPTRAASSSSSPARAPTCPRR